MKQGAIIPANLIELLYGTPKEAVGSLLPFEAAELAAKQGFQIREVTMPLGCVLEFVPAQPMHRRAEKRRGDFYIRDLSTGASKRVTLGPRYTDSQLWEIVDA